MKIKDENIYYQAPNGAIRSEEEWGKMFKSIESACVWYKCDETEIQLIFANEKFTDEYCEHPQHLCPKASGFKEVQHYGIDEEGSLMWEEV